MFNSNIYMYGIWWSINYINNIVCLGFPGCRYDIRDIR